jgi:hypothetical protein
MNRRYHSAVVYRNKMYVFGGLIEIWGSTDELWSFDLGMFLSVYMHSKK